MRDGKFTGGERELDPVKVHVGARELNAQHVFALCNFGGFAFHIAVGIPVFALRHRDGIGNGLAIDKESEATDVETACHVGAEHELACDNHVHRVFEPFTALRVTDSITIAILCHGGIGAAEANHVHAIFAVNIAFIHEILIAERNALPAHIVVFGLDDTRKGRYDLESGLRDSITEVGKRDVIDAVRDVLVFTLETGSGRNRLDIATVVAFCKLARLITADTTRSIPVRVIFDNKATRTLIEVNRQNPIVRPLGSTVIV